MTLPSHKKHQIIVPNSLAQRTIDPSSRIATSHAWIRRALRGSIIQAAMLSSVVIGMESTSDAQQAPTWAPQPFVKSPTVSESTASRELPVPRNSLRDGNATQEPEVLRWQPVNIENREPAKSTSFSQSIPSSSIPQSRKPRSEVTSTQPVESNHWIRQPQSQDQVNAGTSASPRSGFMLPSERDKAASLASRGESKIQLANYSNEPAPRSTQPSKNSSGVWYDRSNDSQSQESRLEIGASSHAGIADKQTSKSRLSLQQSGVQKARYQEPQSDPLANGILDLPPGKDSFRSPLIEQTPSPDSDDLQATEPPRMQLPQPKGSLIDPESVVPPSPFQRSKSKDNRSPSDTDEPLPFGKDSDKAPKPPKKPLRSVVNCDSLRQLVAESDITKIIVDSSPRFVEGYRGKDRKQGNTKEDFVNAAETRSWNDLQGNLLAEGKLVDISLGMVVIERTDGTRTAILMRKLSETDQVYIGEKWGIPVTCSVDDGSFPRRDFIDTTVTWKAAGACHKPLYFEEVQLERYGHEWGPVAQPLISSANFFGNLAFLPYKMGIHPMNECQYSLGYYRPGSCAPWTVGPIPISLRGALSQAKVVSGLAWAMP